MQTAEPSTTQGHTVPNHIAHFFAKYAPQFTYNAQNSAATEFYRLCDTFAWERWNPDRTLAWGAYTQALTLQFNANYGTSVVDLASWQALCRHIAGISPIPGTVQRCVQEVKKANINLVDLIDVFTQGGQVPRFESKDAMMAYTRASGKFFPQDDPQAGDLLAKLIGIKHRRYFSSSRTLILLYLKRARGTTLS